ncbi:MAG: PilN domain-containing protein [Patescibacteria group bacterium]
MSRVQFNLLPDTKLAAVKSSRSRNLAVSVALIISAASAAIFLILLATTSVIQKKQLSDADKAIATQTAKLQSMTGLDKMITVQNQLSTLVDLHKNKHISSRIFSYLPEVTPTQVSLGRLSMDFKANTMQIDGTALDQKSVNTFIDTLKFTTYIVNSDDSPKSAFPSVVESSFSIAAKNVSFSLNVTFDPALFGNNILDSQGHAKAPSLQVPKLTTTRSITDDPANLLFNGQNNAAEGR